MGASRWQKTAMQSMQYTCIVPYIVPYKLEIYKKAHENVTDTVDKSSSLKKSLIILKLKQTLEAPGLRVMARIQQGIDDRFHQLWDTPL